MPAIRLTRRQTLIGVAAGASALALPGYSRAAQRPVITHGLQSGDVAHDGAVIWARADRPARLLVEVSTTESFRDARQLPPVDVTSATDYAGKLVVTGLPSDQDIFYRVQFADLYETSLLSEPQTGHFRTAPMTMRDVTFLWSGDTAGQGWGIDESRGGMRTYATMLRHDPDFFIHSGDMVYADGPLAAEQKMPNGEVWRNLITEEKSKVAETLHEFRHNFLYNLLDANVRAFAAQVPILAQWDDHEVHNNWYPGEMLVDDDRYKVKSASLLAARARRTFHEMVPSRGNPTEPGRIFRSISYGPHLDVVFLDMRSYRGPNTRNDQVEPSPVTSFLGRRQIAWLKRALADSRATWKVIASDMPIGMIVRDGDNFENCANGDGPVRGREHEIAELLSFIKHAGVKNVVWITADVHYTAAHHYSPDRAVFQDFEPFWEFVSGPLHAGTFGPNTYDNTFGPRVEFAKYPRKGQKNLPPSEELQFFGKVSIDGASGQMTVSLLDVADTVLWSKTLDPERS